MDSAQQLLFGEFPRTIGVTTPEREGMELRQYIIHSRAEFDGILDKVSGNRNVYASLSAFKPAKVDGDFEGNAVLADKVSFDFDSSAKADPNADADWAHPLIPEHAPDHEVIEKMRSNPDIRDAVLEDVCIQARTLAEESLDEDIPVLGVFSGFGIHLHQFYQSTMSRPGDKMGSIQRRFTSELSLSAVDTKASGKPYRIMRVPNIERIGHHEGEEISTGLYTIPLHGSELAEIAPEQLLALSRSPRPTIGSEPASRPEMKIEEEYLGPGYEDGLGQEKMRPAPDVEIGDGFAEQLVKEITQMPCVYERALGRNPPNDVRVKLGIMFLNAGYSPSETTDIISRLGWVDFDREYTLYQLKKLRESGKGDWSCKTMQAKGLCTRADEKSDCERYGYRGGNKPWQT